MCAVALLTTNLAVRAEDAPTGFNGDLDFYSDYIGRGLTFSNEKPVTQARIEYDFAPGLYAGSAISDKAVVLDKETVEYDLYAGYRKQLSDWTIDVGGITWLYPHSRLDGSNEGYNIVEGTLDVTYKVVGVKIWCDIHDYLGLNGESAWLNYHVAPNGPSSGSSYIDGHFNLPIGHAFSIKLHAGHQFIRNYPQLNYTDWLIGAEFNFKYNVSIGAAMTDTDANQALYSNLQGPPIARRKGVGYLRWSFP